VNFVTIKAQELDNSSIQSSTKPSFVLYIRMIASMFKKRKMEENPSKLFSGIMK